MGMTVKKHVESSSDSGSVEDSDGDGVETAGRNVDDMTDWVAVADAMRASGTSNSAPMNNEGKPISKEKEEPEIPEQSSSPASPHHESKFSRELAIMASMGFGNDAHVLHALEAQNGNIGGSEPATGFPNLSGLPPKVSGRPRIDGFLHTLTCVELVLTARVVPQCSACEVHLRGRVCFTVYKICYVVNTK